MILTLMFNQTKFGEKKMSENVNVWKLLTFKSDRQIFCATIFDSVCSNKQNV